jgi:hypothetical protein
MNEISSEDYPAKLAQLTLDNRALRQALEVSLRQEREMYETLTNAQALGKKYLEELRELKITIFRAAASAAAKRHEHEHDFLPGGIQDLSNIGNKR